MPLGFGMRDAGDWDDKALETQDPARAVGRAEGDLNKHQKAGEEKIGQGLASRGRMTTASQHSKRRPPAKSRTDAATSSVEGSTA